MTNSPIQRAWVGVGTLSKTTFPGYKSAMSWAYLVYNSCISRAYSGDISAISFAYLWQILVKLKVGGQVWQSRLVVRIGCKSVFKIGSQGWQSGLVAKIGFQDCCPKCSHYQHMMCCTSSLLNFWHFLFPPKITVSGRFFGLLVENLECYLKSCFLSHVYVNMSDRSSIFTQETKMRKSTVHSIHSQYISTLSDSCKRYPAVYPYVQFQDHIYAGVDLQFTPSTSSPHLSCT